MTFILALSFLYGPSFNEALASLIKALYYFLFHHVCLSILRVDSNHGICVKLQNLEPL